MIRSTWPQASVYHLLRVVLVVGLLVAGFFTILYWVYLMDLGHGQAMGVQITAREFYGNDTKALDNVIPQVANDLARSVIVGLVMAAAALLALLLLPRVRRYHKSLVITAMVIMGFCFVATVVATPALNSYMRNLEASNRLYPEMDSR